MSYHKSPFCSSPCGHTSSQAAVLQGSPPAMVPKSCNVSQLLGRKPLRCASPWPQASAESQARFRKELAGEEKNAEDRLMNTYTTVIKVLRLHPALSFSSNCFPFLFQPHWQKRTPSSEDWTEQTGEQKERRSHQGYQVFQRQTLGSFFCAAPVPEALHICLASAHYRWLARCYGAFSTVEMLPYSKCAWYLSTLQESLTLNIPFRNTGRDLKQEYVLKLCSPSVQLLNNKNEIYPLVIFSAWPWYQNS